MHARTHAFTHIPSVLSTKGRGSGACDIMTKTNMKAAYGVMCHPSSHICVDAPQSHSLCYIAPDILYKYAARSSSSYLPQSSVLSWIHCPCLETRWNKDGPWSHTQCPFWAQRGWHCAQKGPSHPGSARFLVKAVLMTACTGLCNPEWTGTDDPPEEVNGDTIIVLFSAKRSVQRRLVDAILDQPLDTTKWCFSAMYFFLTGLHSWHFRGCYSFNGPFITSHDTFSSINTLTLPHTPSSQPQSVPLSIKKSFRNATLKDICMSRMYYKY